MDWIRDLLWCTAQTEGFLHLQVTRILRVCCCYSAERTHCTTIECTNSTTIECTNYTTIERTNCTVDISSVISMPRTAFLPSSIYFRRNSLTDILGLCSLISHIRVCLTAL